MDAIKISAQIIRKLTPIYNVIENSKLHVYQSLCFVLYLISEID